MFVNDTYCGVNTKCRLTWTGIYGIVIVCLNIAASCDLRGPSSLGNLAQVVG